MEMSLSRKILIGHMVMFLLALFGVASRFGPFVWLTPNAVIPGMQIWRLVSYPLAIELLSLLIGAISFSSPGEELEQMLGTRSFGWHLLGVVILAGLLHTLTFLHTGVRMSGTTNPALFTLIGFVYLFPHSEIRLFFFSIRSWVILAFAAAVIVFFSLFKTIAGGQSPLLFFSLGGYGLVFGSVYFHIRYQKYAVLLGPIRSIERLMAPGVRHLGDPARSTVGGGVHESAGSRLRMAFQKAPVAELTDEERLDEILDRINERGYDALSDDDREFLEEYSGR